MTSGSSIRRVAFLFVSLVAGSAINSGTPPTASAVPIAHPEAANPFRTGRTLVIAHAGGDALFPENTLFAYEQSTALGSEVIDLDVSMSSDGVLVAFHDSTLNRTTNGKGQLRALTYAELSKLDAGFRFTRNGRQPFRGRGLRIPTIEAVLKRFPRMLATLDLKDQRVELAQPVCALLRRLGRANNVYVGSDSSDQVLAFRKECPEVHTSGTDDERRAARAARESGDPNYVTKQLVSQPRYLGSDGTKRVTVESLAFAHRNGTAVLTWVIDDPAVMNELLDLGVDGIYTRRPDVLARIVKERAQRR